jgi:hypothetical protein
MSAVDIPAFDPESPDAEILEASARVWANRAYGYGFDDLEGDRPEHLEKELEALDAEQALNEKTVTANWATTPSGVAAQLMLALAEGGCDRWIDRGLADHGLRALYQQRDRLDGTEQIIVTAAYELIHIEWERALENWERSNANFEYALKIKGVIEGENFDLRAAQQQPGPLLTSITEACGDIEEQFSDHKALWRLVCTLTPDPEAYRRKAEIVLAEEYSTYAGPWLVRDVNFLFGSIQPEQVAA